MWHQETTCSLLKVLVKAHHHKLGNSNESRRTVKRFRTLTLESRFFSTAANQKQKIALPMESEWIWTWVSCTFKMWFWKYNKKMSNLTRSTWNSNLLHKGAQTQKQHGPTGRIGQTETRPERPWGGRLHGAVAFGPTDGSDPTKHGQTSVLLQKQLKSCVLFWHPSWSGPLCGLYSLPEGGTWWQLGTGACLYTRWNQAVLLRAVVRGVCCIIFQCCTMKGGGLGVHLERKKHACWGGSGSHHQVLAQIFHIVCRGPVIPLVTFQLCIRAYFCE